MKLHHPSMSALGAALRANRQFTLGERMQSEEALGILRRAALARLGLSAPMRRADEGDGVEAVRLKKAGLYEANGYLYSPDCDLDENMRLIFGGLIDAACVDYRAMPSHKQAMPTQVAQATHARALKSAEDARYDYLRARLDDLEARCLALEEMQTSVPSVNPESPE